MIAWLSAYLFTVAFEMPVWAWGMRRAFPDGRALVALAFGVSLATHPALWRLYAPTAAVEPSLFVAEGMVVLVEALLAWVLWSRRGVTAASGPRCLVVSLAANSVSTTLGLVLFG